MSHRNRPSEGPRSSVAPPGWQTGLCGRCLKEVAGEYGTGAACRSVGAGLHGKRAGVISTPLTDFSNFPKDPSRVGGTMQIRQGLP